MNRFDSTNFGELSIRMFTHWNDTAKIYSEENWLAETCFWNSTEMDDTDKKEG